MPQTRLVHRTTDCEDDHMIEVMRRIYVGSDRDYDSIGNRATWAILHCCKHPFHCKFVGYRGRLSSNHPNYAFRRKNNEMALDLLDIAVFSPDCLGFNAKMTCPTILVCLHTSY